MFQYVGESALRRGEAQAAGTPLDQARELVARYPNLSEIELARLIDLYRHFSALDMALLLSDEKIAPRLDCFSSENRSKIRPPFRQYAGLMAYAFLTLSVVAWAILRALSQTGSY
jgi:hypothetical protein